MATIGTFTAQGNGYTGTIRTLTLHNIKAKLVPSDKDSNNAKAPDFRVMVGNFVLGAAWKKIANNSDRPYLSVSIDDPSFPDTIYARLIEGEDGNFDLIWSRSNKAR